MRTTITRVLAALSPTQRLAGLGLLGLMVVGMVLETLGIGLMIPTLALMMHEDLGTRWPALQPLLIMLGNPTQIQLITGAMLGLVGLFLLKNLFLAFLAWRLNRFSYRVQGVLSQRIFTIYMRQPWTFHLQRNSAELMRNVLSETSMFSTVLTGMLTIATEVLVLTAIASLLMFIEPVGAAIVVTVLGGASWVFYRSTRRWITSWGERRQFHAALTAQHLLQGLGGAKDVKLLGRESDFLEQFANHQMKALRVTELQTTMQQVPRLWLETLAVAGLATLVITMLGQGMSMAEIVPVVGVFAAAAFRLMPSVSRIIGAVQAVRYGLPVIGVVHQELQLTTPALAVAGPERVEFQDEIRLERVGFRYAGAPAPAVDGVSLVIRKGESVGLIGASGSGKSTLVDIVLGLLEPDTGQVLVDAQDIRDDLRRWQNQIGYVPQTIYLTDDSLRRNIAFGIPVGEVDDDAIRRAVRAAQLDEFVASLPDGIDTAVGERGVRLSGGQRQRIGIARALYHDPGVLVLDEATSALDMATERGVMRAVTALQRSKTLLIVAHRLTTVQHCDRIYRLEHGRVVAEGAPAEMLVTPSLENKGSRHVQR